MGEITKKKIAQQQSGFARSARICCSQPRPPPPFHSCAPGPELALARLPRPFREAHARSWPCVRRGGAEGRAGGRGARAREARGRGQPRGADRRCGEDLSPAGAASSEQRAQGTFSRPGRRPQRREGVSARGAGNAHPTMAASAGRGGCTRPSPGTHGGQLSAVSSR